MAKDTGDSAFPNQTYTGELDQGMTLRDYFAAKAMQSFITLLPNTDNPEEAAGHVCGDAYTIADAMLEARK